VHDSGVKETFVINTSTDQCVGLNDVLSISSKHTVSLFSSIGKKSVAQWSVVNTDFSHLTHMVQQLWLGKYILILAVCRQI